MMARQQYLLIKLAEEASEVAQMALKCAQFGQDEVMPGQPLTNYQRLEGEIMDFYGVRQMLMVETGLLMGLALDEVEYRKRITAKIDKVNHFYHYCQQLGTVS